MTESVKAKNFNKSQCWPGNKIIFFNVTFLACFSLCVFISFSNSTGFFCSTSVKPFVWKSRVSSKSLKPNQTTGGQMKSIWLSIKHNIKKSFEIPIKATHTRTHKLMPTRHPIRFPIFKTTLFEKFFQTTTRKKLKHEIKHRVLLDFSSLLQYDMHTTRTLLLLLSKKKNLQIANHKHLTSTFYYYTW